MSLAWMEYDADFFRKLDIDVDEPQLKREPKPYVAIAWLIFWFGCGGAWYGLLRLTAWGLRALGVAITGI